MDGGPESEPHVIATVAHELRNPLASLRMSLDMLVHDFDELPAEAAYELIQRAQRSVDWLYRMTENLTWSTSEVDNGSVDVLTCIREAEQLVRASLHARHQSLRVNGPDTAHALGDSMRITQVVTNLLSNASRYSVEGDELRVDVSVVGEIVRVRVTDHGPGISQADQLRIFQPWVRGDRATPGGMGLGLHIVQDLVHRMGGQVGLASTPGHGASFSFTLIRDIGSHR